jgi:Putative Flp pilus-assembly TadE/G-like
MNFFRTTSRKRQSGQLLPIAAAAFLVMCGLAGLAIDSSRDYLVKRNAQNAADFAVLAASKQMSLSTSFASPPVANSNGVKAAHDFAANNGFWTQWNNACDVSTPTSFHTEWDDTAGVACGASSGFSNKVQVNSPPVALPGNPVPLACQGAGAFSCVQVVITTRISELFTAVLGIPYAYVTVSAAAQAVLPGSSISTPPPNALLLYQPQSGCNAASQQCFDETQAVSRTGLSCGGTSNCPTFWAVHGAQPKIFGYDGAVLTTPGDYTTVQSNGDMVIQDRTTICDPYNGAACVANAVVGAQGFAIPSGSKIYCQKFGAGAAIITPCTTTGQSSLNEIDANQTGWTSPYYWYPTVDTSGLASCGSLILNGQPVYGPCAPDPSEPYTISPGIYSYIVINHGTYEFEQGLYDITGVAPVNTLTSGSYFANGIDHKNESAGNDFDLCTGGQPNSCPTLTAGVWMGHGGGGFGAYVAPVPGSCTGGSSGSDGGGGDQTIISGSNVVFRLESSSGGFVSTHEVKSLSLAGAGVGGLPAVAGAPLLIDEENSSFIHLDGQNPSAVSGIMYQTPNATAGGFEFNPGMSSGGSNPAALTGQVLAYSFTSFGQSGNGIDFRNGYGTGGVPNIATSGKNETQIISSVSLTATPGMPGFSTLTVNYTDEWMMDGYNAYVKINNATPTFFSQGIWTTTPNPGDPLPPPNNVPGDNFPAYPSILTPGNYTINSATYPAPNDWLYTIPGGSGAYIEVKGQWTWGHQSDIAGANSGSYTAQLLYTFPTPNGTYVSITLFVTDGDHCGDYAYASYTFKNIGSPGPGQQTVGSVALVG